jgi:hypothetical protein
MHHYTHHATDNCPGKMDDIKKIVGAFSGKEDEVRSERKSAL